MLQIQVYVLRLDSTSRMLDNIDTYAPVNHFASHEKEGTEIEKKKKNKRVPRERD